MVTDCYLDSSAVIAILLGEPRADSLEKRLSLARQPRIGAPTLVEAVMVLSHRWSRDPRIELKEFLFRYQVDVDLFGPLHYERAAHAFLRYGKGRHPARLNFGDCLAYAGAMLADWPLLYVGNDFALTDIQPAIPPR